MAVRRREKGEVDELEAESAAMNGQTRGSTSHTSSRDRGEYHDRGADRDGRRGLRVVFPRQEDVPECVQKRGAQRQGECSSRHLCGAEHSPYRSPPLVAPRGCLVTRHRRLVARAGTDVARERLEVVPDADCNPGERRSAERRRLGVGSNLDGTAEHVGLELHEEAVGRRSSVGTQNIDSARKDVEHVGDQEPDRLQRRTREVRPRRAPL